MMRVDGFGVCLCVLVACGGEAGEQADPVGTAAGMSGASGAHSGGNAGIAGGGAGTAGGGAGTAGGGAAIAGSAGGTIVTVTEVISFMPGKHAGFGADKMPDIVFGLPDGGGPLMGSLDVVSLGVGGQIVVGFGPHEITDGPGPDFIVFENPFYIGGNKDNPFKELGEVSVSADGVEWKTFPCEPLQYKTTHCAGWRPVMLTKSNSLPANDPEKTGGDPFDLSVVGLKKAKYVKVRDLSSTGAGTTAGFDLDAVVVIHAVLQ